MTDSSDTRLTGAYELGCSRGWDHANFVDAYGPEHETHKRDVTTPYGEIHDQHPLYHSFATPPERWAENDVRRKQRAEYLRGWTDGRKRFHRGQYPDGTKIPD